MSSINESSSVNSRETAKKSYSQRQAYCIVSTFDLSIRGQHWNAYCVGHFSYQGTRKGKKQKDSNTENEMSDLEPTHKFPDVKEG
jgi:hypothetical protein